MKMALTTRQQVREVKRLLDREGVMTLEQLTRLGLQRGAAALGLHAEVRTVRLDRSPRLLTPTFVSLKPLQLRPTPTLTHLALLGEGTRALGLSPTAWAVVRPHSSGPTPDGVWIRGPVGAGMDWALEVETSYKRIRVDSKFTAFGPPARGLLAGNSGAAHLGYRGVVWIVTNHLRRDRVGRRLTETAGFGRFLPVGDPLPPGVQAYVRSENGRTLNVWVMCVHL